MASNSKANSEIELFGEKKRLRDWCEHYGTPLSRCYARLHIGWSVEKAIIAPKVPATGRPPVSAR